MHDHIPDIERVTKLRTEKSIEFCVTNFINKEMLFIYKKKHLQVKKFFSYRSSLAVKNCDSVFKILH
jgi:hypothetical protein